MKTLMALVLAVSTSASFAQKPAAEATTYKVDPATTKVTYVGKKVTGEHTGNVKVKSGTLTYDGQKLTGGDVVMDMTTIDSTDITDKDTNAKYVGHMKSADFFNTEKYPESRLVIKESKKTDKGLEITGDLTMIGKTAPVKFLATDVKSTGDAFSAKANVEIDRTQWGLKYGSGQFFKGLGDKMIHDKFTLAVDLNAKK